MRAGAPRQGSGRGRSQGAAPGRAARHGGPHVGRGRERAAPGYRHRRRVAHLRSGRATLTRGTRHHPLADPVRTVQRPKLGRPGSLHPGKGHASLIRHDPGRSCLRSNIASDILLE